MASLIFVCSSLISSICSNRRIWAALLWTASTVSKPRICLFEATRKLYFDLFYQLHTVLGLLNQNVNCLKHYHPITMVITWRKLAKAIMPTLKLIVYSQIDQWFCILSCISVFFALSGDKSLYFSTLSLYSSLTAKPSSQSIASCGSWILKGQSMFLRYFSKNLGQSLLGIFLKLCLS